MAHVGKECPRAAWQDLYVRHNVRDPVPRKLCYRWTAFGSGTEGTPWRSLTIVSAVQQVNATLDEYTYTFENPNNGAILTILWTLVCTVPAASNGYHCTPYWKFRIHQGITLIAESERRIFNQFPFDTFPTFGENCGIVAATGIPPSVFGPMSFNICNASWSQQPEYKPLNYISSPGTENIYGDPI